MSGASEEFGENPFRNLKFAAKPSPGAAQQEPPALTAEERSLFLRAWDKMPEQRRRKRQRGFAFADLCPLPTLAVKKRAKPAKQAPEIKPPEREKDSEAVFLDAMRDIQPLAARGRAVPRRPEAREPLAERAASMADVMEGKLAFAVSFSDEYLEGFVAGLDELLLNRLREGQLSPEAHLDLHGMSAEQAFDALAEFIHDAWLKDLKTVLVVTGRGRNSPAGQSVLRHKLQSWLIKEPFKRVVLAFCTAKPHDGGPGAIYVLLRKSRKKGPVQWQRQYIAGEYD